INTNSVPLSINLFTQETVEKINFDLIDTSFSIISSAYDFDFGGLGNGMKFPHPTVDKFMLAYSAWTGDNIGMKLSEFTLKRMFIGGIFDQAGGGFHRYATDREWWIPHFEKLLIDNAELLEDYYNFYLASGSLEIKEAFDLTYEFIRREMMGESGFFNSIDADSEDIEGKYYTWTEDEFIDAIGKDEQALKIFGFHEDGGTVEGRKVLKVSKDIRDLSRELGKDVKSTLEYLREIRKKLLEYREKNRKKPNYDTNTYSYPNFRLSEVLILSVKDPFSLKITENIRGKVTRRLSGGKDGLLEDYSSALLALLASYEVTGEEKFYNSMIDLGKQVKDFMTSDGFVESKDFNDYSFLDMPNESPNSLAIRSLIKLSVIDNDFQLNEGLIRKLVNSDPSFI
ncbi:thioredoxin domain-containing protein, partial [Acidianus sp. DSM 29099]|nr:thioredoxin domain-containing protein [Acidianus sp. RZ1]